MRKLILAVALLIAPLRRASAQMFFTPDTFLQRGEYAGCDVLGNCGRVEIFILSTAVVVNWRFDVQQSSYVFMSDFPIYVVDGFPFQTALVTDCTYAGVGPRSCPRSVLDIRLRPNPELPTSLRVNQTYITPEQYAALSFDERNAFFYCTFCNGPRPRVDNSFVMTAVPEPSPLLLTGIGMVGLFLGRRTRRKMKA